MHVLVTGGAGFIGANFLYHLAEVRPDWKVTTVDKLTYAGNIESIAPLLQEKKATFLRADIADEEAMRQLFLAQHFDIVFNFAAESHVDRSILSAAEFVRTNVMGTEVLLSCARNTNVGKFVQVSTDEVYGSLGPTGRFVESTPLDPSSPYSSSKAGADLLALSFHRTHGMNVVVTRCTNNYGPYQFPEKLIPLFISNALEDKPLPLYGDGMNVRSWLYVTDHCEAILMVGEKGRAGEVYNVGGAEEAELPNVEVTRTILRLLKKPETLVKRVGDRPGHDRRYAIDYTKINRELGWKPRTPFGPGMEKTLAWYLGNRKWWEEIKSGAYREYYERNYAARA
jgi:dTDP-glucose 4,6-dehydratase